MSTELSVPTRVQIINEKIHALKQDFERYIVDPSFPLSERWDVFVSATTDLSNHQPYIARELEPEVDLDVYADGNTGRGEVIKATDIINRFIDEYSYTKEVEWEEGEDKAAPIKEKILALNLKSFRWDW